MNCETALDLVADSLMDRIDENVKSDLREHLTGCESCAKHAEQMQTAWSELGRLNATASQGVDSRGIVSPLSKSSRKRVRSHVLRVAAAVVLLIAGAALGRIDAWNQHRANDAPVASSGNPYLLLIRSDEPDRRAPEAQLVSEYGDWATELATRGALIGAEKLTGDAGRWVQGETAAGDTDIISGFFVISAANYDEAERAALASPHVAYGGTIEIRAIENTGESR